MYILIKRENASLQLLSPSGAIVIGQVCWPVSRLVGWFFR